MKSVLCLFLLLLTVPQQVTGAAPAPAAGARPNFVFIIGDDISSEDIGCFGNPGIRTPNIDRLAAESRVFDNAYVTASSCSPSRCSIITSRYPHNLETAAELHRALPEGVALFPKVLREAGYFTALAGKSHFGEGGEHPTGPAKAAFEVSSGAVRTDLGAGAGGQNNWIQHLRDRPTDRPFFMWFASFDAHRSWNAQSFSGMNRPADVRVPPYLADTPETREDLAHYYDEITRLDYYVGEVVRELKRQQVLEQTIIIFLSDNGRPFPHSKTQVYDDGMKTPLIIRMPAGTARPGRTAALASSIDLGPTVLELAGLPKPETFQGVSLVPLLRDPRATVRDYVFAEHNWHNFPAHVRMVRRGSHVYVRNAWPELRLPGASDTFYNPSADALKALHAQGRLTPAQAKIFMPRPAEEFYDLSADPHQTVNLVRQAGSHEPTLQQLRAVLTRWQQETGDSVPANPTPPDIDYATGKRKTEFWRGTPPGADANALKINHPGPIRAHRVE
jgi:N-sulfoglucosamine sulfohydrolase